jgi:hypothetical protein
MKAIFLVICTIFLVGCTTSDKSEGLSINVVDVNIYLKDSNGEGRLPPILFINMEIYNKSNMKRIFIAESSYNISKKSKLILTDTVKNQVLPLFSNETQVLLPRSRTQVESYIELHEIKDYLNLSDDFFSKLDYTSEKLLLKKLCVKMLNNSRIIYYQDKEQALKQRLFDKDIEPLQEKVKINIPKNINVRE